MGAGESKTRGSNDASSTGPPDYYTLLEVDEFATPDEIKVSELDSYSPFLNQS